ncbi:MAG: hypothetical protein KDA81_05675 [Planctomycetaceae bacterium]|nr:hypothetical protein [Planctomycetaceae bacterium]
MSRPLSPQSTSLDILYAAFRAAFVRTFDSLLTEFLPGQSRTPSRGFLEQISLTCGCAPQVQLDVLLVTWRRIRSEVDGELDLGLLHQCVVYCALEELADVSAEENPSSLRSILERGPRQIRFPDVQCVTSALRTVQVTWPFSVDVATIHQNPMLLNVRMDNSGTIGQTQRRLVSQLLELVGRWKVSPEILTTSRDLLSHNEHRAVANFFHRFPELLISEGDHDKLS